MASHASYTLDLAFGSGGENDFDLQVEDAALKAGSRTMIDGTEYGGIIDDTDVDVDGGLSTVTWHGRDWHGVLASKIIEPDRNNDYLTLSGTIPVIMRTLVSRAGLQGLFTSPKKAPTTRPPASSTGTWTCTAVWSRCSGKRTQTPVA